jgi:hypothetical protein
VLKIKWFPIMLLSMAMAAMSLLAPSFQAQEKTHTSVAGVWKMTSETPDGDSLPWNLTIKQQDGKWAATSGTDQGETAVKDFTVTGNKIHFKAPYQDQDYDIDLTLTGDKLEGTWSGGSDSGKTSGTRASS